MSDTVAGSRKKPRESHDVDTGFAWIVLIGCFTVNMFVVGSAKAFGVLYTEMVEYYSSGSGNTAWIGSLVIVMSGLGPVANYLCKVYTFRRITVIGGVLFGLGYFLSGFVTRIEYMYMTFTISGIGYGLTFAPCMTIVSYYFNKRRTFASGITVSGSSVCAIYLPFLYKYLIERYGLKGTFWIIGAMFANVSVAACMFRQPRYFAEERNESSHDETNVGEGQSSSVRSDENVFSKINKRHCIALDMRFSLFKNALYTLYVLSFMFCAFAYVATLILIPASVKTYGNDKTHVALALTIYGGVEVVTRPLIGLFADLNIIQRKYIYVVSMLIGGGFSLVAPLFENFVFIAVYATIAATFPASFFSLISSLIIDVVGLEDLSPAFGLVTFCMAVAVLPSQPAVGWLYDEYGNWHLSFILTGCMYILAGVILLLEPIVVRCCTKIDNKGSSSSSNQQQSHDQDRPTEGGCKYDVGRPTDGASEDDVGRVTVSVCKDDVSRPTDRACKDDFDRPTDGASEDDAGRPTCGGCKYDVGRPTDGASEDDVCRVIDNVCKDDVGRPINCVCEDDGVRQADDACKDDTGRPTNGACEEDVGRPTVGACEEDIGRPTNGACKDVVCRPIDLSKGEVDRPTDGACEDYI